MPGRDLVLKGKNNILIETVLGFLLGARAFVQYTEGEFFRDDCVCNNDREVMQRAMLIV